VVVIVERHRNQISEPVREFPDVPLGLRIVVLDRESLSSARIEKSEIRPKAIDRLRFVSVDSSDVDVDGEPRRSLDSDLVEPSSVVIQRLDRPNEGVVRLCRELTPMVRMERESHVVSLDEISDRREILRDLRPVGKIREFVLGIPREERRGTSIEEDVVVHVPRQYSDEISGVRETEFGGVVDPSLSPGLLLHIPITSLIERSVHTRISEH